jgi:hypothetical protein
MMRSRSLRLLVLLVVILVAAAACNSSRPTQYLLEVTREVPVTVIVVVTATAEGDTVASAADETPETEPTLAPTEVVETTPEPTPDPFPAPVIDQVIVAEQAFQNGRMFYLQPNQEIWVLIHIDDDTGGVWTRHRDTWSEDLPELDPSIVPPEEDLYQPIRGFGKLWRENPAVREALGWALEDEMGHVTDYAYYAGGEVTADGEYIPGPGYHTVRSRFGQTYIFDETNGTWRIEDPATDE